MGKGFSTLWTRAFRANLLDMEHASIRRQHFFAACIFIGVLLFFYSDVVFYGRTFLMETATAGTMPNGGPYNYQGVTPGFTAVDPGAIAWQIEPFNKFISESIRKGDFPLWNPYSGLAGGPLFADGHTAPLEPIQFLFFLVPFRRYWPASVDLQLLLRFFIAGLSCYLFARRLRINFLGSVTAGILFMLQPYFIAFGNHPQVKTETLLPLVLYGYDRAADREDKLGMWLCALFIGWAIIAGMPESTFFSLFLGTLWYFYKIIFIKRQFGKDAWLRYAGASGLGVMISAVYLFPLFELIAQAKSMHHPDVFRTSWPLHGMPGLIFGAVNTHHIRIGFVAFFSLFFSLINIKEWPDRQKEIIFFGFYASFFLLVMFNIPPVNWVTRLPVFNQIGMNKYPFPSIHFSIAMLTGIVIDRARKFPLSTPRIISALFLVCLIVIAFPMLFAPAQTTYFNDMRDQDNLFKLIAALSFVLINLNIFFESRKIFFQAGIVLVFVAEILLGTSIFDRPSRVYPYQSPPFVSYLRKDPDSFRIFGMDNILYPNIATAYQIQDIRWLNALIPQRVYDFSLRFIGTEEELNTIRYTGITFPKSVKMMNLLNVKYIISAAELDGRVGQSAQFHNVYFDKNIHVYQNDDVLPRAFVVHHVLNVDGFQEALNQMDVSSFDPAQVAVVENLPAELSMLINQHEQLGLPSVGAVKLVNSGQLDVTVTSESPGLLVVTDQYYPGWQVFVDGEQSTLYAVDGIFRGVFLEKGFHSIQFKYRPLSFIIGAIISILSLLVVVIFIISTLKVLHKNE